MKVFLGHTRSRKIINRLQQLSWGRFWCVDNHFAPAALIADSAKNRVAEARRSMELSPAEFANRMGVTVRTVQKWEAPRYEDLTTPWPPEPACRHAQLLAGIDAMRRRLEG
jgi:hypothetical protein